MPDASLEVYNVCCYNKGSGKFSVQRPVHMAPVCARLVKMSVGLVFVMGKQFSFNIIFNKIIYSL